MPPARSRSLGDVSVLPATAEAARLALEITLMGQGGISCPKPTPRRILKARRKRRAAKVVKSVRAQCVARDGFCRISRPAMDLAGRPLGDCAGPSEWAHMAAARRWKTRGQAPEVRHTTAGSLMLCRGHHNAYDREHTLEIVPLTTQGANGPLRFLVSSAKAHRRIP